MYIYVCTYAYTMGIYVHIYVCDIYVYMSVCLQPYSNTGPKLRSNIRINNFFFVLRGARIQLGQLPCEEHPPGLCVSDC